ncbi:MAG TPA: hypothetical protein VG435_05800 [Acidimicrobiales bacterium]|jgi:hypothetical protein|nr:hypothetical protein [Acidimicrobiales bacterium]
MPSGQRSGPALLLVLLVALAGCTSRSSDPGAIAAPSTSIAPLGSPTVGGPAVTFSGNRPQVAGHPAASSVLDVTGTGLQPSCQPVTERSDPNLVSILWHCGSQVTAATVTLSGRPVELGDILKGDYRSYLSSVATTQFAYENLAHAATTDFSTWYLTPAALAVVFPDGIVSYPIPSLSAYLSDPSSL